MEESCNEREIIYFLYTIQNSHNLVSLRVFSPNTTVTLKMLIHSFIYVYFLHAQATERRQRDLAFLQPVVVGPRHFSLKAPSRSQGNNTNGSCSPESVTLTKLSVEQKSPCRNSRSSTPAIRPRWFIWNRTSTPSTDCVDPVTSLELLTPSSRCGVSDSVVGWSLGGQRRLATSTYGESDRVMTSSLSGSHLIRSVSGSRGEITPPAPSTTGISRSLLELCRHNKTSSATPLEEEFDDSPGEGNSALLTPTTAISVLALTPRYEPQPGRLGAGDVIGMSRSQLHNNISIIDEEVQTCGNRIENVDVLTNLGTAGVPAPWPNSNSLGWSHCALTRYFNSIVTIIV